MLHAKARGFETRTYTLTKDDNVVAEMPLSIIGEAGTLKIENEKSLFRRIAVKGFPERFQLEDRNGNVVAYAEQPNPKQSRFVITFGELTLELSKPSIWRNTFTLLLNGEQAGRIRPKIFFSVRRATVDLPDAVPLNVQSFIFWLAVVLWTRDGFKAAYKV